MKNKILTTALILGSLYTSAKAIEIKPYAGVDVGYNKTQTSPEIIVNAVENQYEYKTGIKDDKGINYGINVGSKFYFNDEIYSGLELSYKFGNILDTKTKAFHIDVYDYKGGEKVEQMITEPSEDEYTGLSLEMVKSLFKGFIEKYGL